MDQDRAAAGRDVHRPLRDPPGIIKTEMTAQVAGRYDKLIAEGRVPARRWGERADVASVAVALAGGAFGFASGTVVNVDGGLAIPRL